MINISQDVKLDFDDVLLVPQFGEVDISSRSDVRLDRIVKTTHSGKLMHGIGIIAANMDGVGTIEVAKRLAMYKIYTALKKNYSIDRLVDWFEIYQASDYSFYSMGVSDSDWDKFIDVSNTVNIPNICLDVPNGYIGKFYDTISRIRDRCPEAIIMAGNVVTPEAVEAVARAGADIVKMGIGPGSVCSTRLQTAVGYPQLSCILDSIQSAKQNKILLCSDGGCVVPGHLSVAYAAGADFVMLGGMLAGTDEGGGFVEDGYVQFYGMSSKTANEKHSGGLKGYRASEGRTVMIPYKGDMDNVIQNILGGLRSTVTYLGYNNIDEMVMGDNKAIRVNSTYNRSMERYTIGN